MRNRLLVAATAVMCALGGCGCSGLKSGQDTDKDAASDAPAMLDDSGSDDVSTEQAPDARDDGDAGADDTDHRADRSLSDGGDGAPFDGRADAQADAGGRDTGGEDATNPRDTPDGDAPYGDAAEDASIDLPDADDTGADASGDSGDESSSKDAWAVDVVVVGRFTEFAPPMSIESVTEIVAGPDGALWLPNPATGSLIRMTTAGQFSESPVPGPLEGGSGTPNLRGLIVGPDGNFWVGEPNSPGGLDRITRMTLQGVFTSFLLPATVQPMGLAAGPDGLIWFTDLNNRTVDRMTTEGQVTAFNLLGSPWPEPGSIVAGPDDNLWFTQTGPNKIGRISTAGVFIEVSVPTPNASPNAIAPGPDGNLWFTELDGQRVGRVKPGTFVEVSEFPLRGPDAAAISTRRIAAGPDGKLWITQDGRLMSITTDGATAQEYLCPTDCSPHGITTGSDNMIWYVDKRRLVIGRFMP